MPLRNKVALVTGGSSGIGRATGILFAQGGAKVVIASDKNVKGGEETVHLIQQAGGDGIFVSTDVSRPVEVEALVNGDIEKTISSAAVIRRNLN